MDVNQKKEKLVKRKAPIFGSELRSGRKCKICRRKRARGDECIWYSRSHGMANGLLFGKSQRRGRRWWGKRMKKKIREYGTEGRSEKRDNLAEATRLWDKFALSAKSFWPRCTWSSSISVLSVNEWPGRRWRNVKERNYAKFGMWMKRRRMDGQSGVSSI